MEGGGGAAGRPTGRAKTCAFMLNLIADRFLYAAAGLSRVSRSCRGLSVRCLSCRGSCSRFVVLCCVANMDTTTQFFAVVRLDRIRGSWCAGLHGRLIGLILMRLGGSRGGGSYEGGGIFYNGFIYGSVASSCRQVQSDMGMMVGVH